MLGDVCGFAFIFILVLVLVLVLVLELGAGIENSVKLSNAIMGYSTHNHRTGSYFRVRG